MTIEDIDMNQLKENLDTVFVLEYFGIHIEDVKEQDGKCLYFFSVPQISTLQTSDDTINEKIKDGYSLIKLAKELLTEMIVESCRAVFGEDEDEDEEFYENVKENISQYALFYAKVRRDESWNKEMAEAASRKVLREIRDNAYERV